MNELAAILKDSPLPGVSAHMQMAPAGRRPELDTPGDDAVDSAVLLLLFEQSNQQKITFIERAEYEGIHSGQISFPGGKTEPGDADFSQTAIRETIEETGVQIPVTIIGTLTDLYVPPSNYIIHPFVGYVSGIPQFMPDPDEVQSVFTVDLAWLASEKSRSEYRFFHRGKWISAPCFMSDTHIIWGATAMILNEFLVHLHNHGFFKNQLI